MIDIVWVSQAFGEVTVPLFRPMPMDSDVPARDGARMTALQWADMHEGDGRYLMAVLEKNEAVNGAGADTAQVRGGSEEEREEEGEGSDVAEPTDTTYILIFYGGIQHVKSWFELKGGIPEAVLAKDISDKKDFVRYMECTMDAIDLERVATVLEDVLEQMPVYFINMAGEADPMARWLCQQASIVEVES